jgi:hypothetical protein
MAFHIQAVTGNGSGSGRGSDLKMETLPIIKCVQ